MCPTHNRRLKTVLRSPPAASLAAAHTKPKHTTQQQTCSVVSPANWPLLIPRRSLPRLSRACKLAIAVSASATNRHAMRLESRTRCNVLATLSEHKPALETVLSLAAHTRRQFGVVNKSNSLPFRSVISQKGTFAPTHAPSATRAFLAKDKSYR